MSWKMAKWINGKMRVEGAWKIMKDGKHVLVMLDMKDHKDGGYRSHVIPGTHPEWGGWRLYDQRHF